MPDDRPKESCMARIALAPWFMLRRCCARRTMGSDAGRNGLGDRREATAALAAAIRDNLANRTIKN